MGGPEPWKGLMSITTALRGAIVLSVLCGACADERGPLAPSPPASSLPQLGGNYMLTLTTCELPVGKEMENSPIGPYQSIWTLTQQDDAVTGRFNGSSPPGLSSGTLTARVDGSGKVVDAKLQFSWSSSHVGLLQFAASGDGSADKTQIVGTVSGEESFTMTFGGITGNRYACSGTGMPFRFARVN